MERVLDWFGRRPGTTVGIIGAAMVTYILAHEQVQVPIILFRNSISPFLFRLVVGFGGLLALLALAVWLLRQPRRGPSVALKRGYLVMGAILAFLSYGFLIVADSEIAHFPQYGLLFIPVFALSRSIGESVVWVTLLGMVDEAYQYGVRHADWGIPYDFNDVVLNLVGAGLACTVVMFLTRTSEAQPVRRRRPRPGYVILGGLFGAATVLYLTGHLAIRYTGEGPAPLVALSRLTEKPFWFFDPTWGHKPIHLLHPVEGAVLIILLVLVYAYLDTRVAVFAGNPESRTPGKAHEYEVIVETGAEDS